MGAIFEDDLEPFLSKIQAESLATAFLSERASGTFIYAHCFQFVQLAFAIEGISPSDATIVAKELEAQARARLRKRQSPTAAQKEELWHRNYSKRCGYCGARFGQWAKEKFLYGQTGAPQPRRLFYVDVMKGRGSNLRHFQIEVDHRQPLNDMGSNDIDNFALVCGWCNAVKGDKTHAFDSPYLQSGTSTSPQKWWTLRHLLLNPQCSVSANCERNVRSDEMTVAPQNSLLGMLNPAKFVTCCKEHDPMPNNRRLIPRETGSATQG